MRTKARRVVVVVFDEVELLDVAAPLEVLSTAGRRWNFRPYKVEVAAPQPGLVATRNQVRLEATFALSAVAPAEIVLVPGGYGARRFADDPTAIAELARIAAGAEIIAGIAGGVIALSRAGLIAGARVAASKEMSATLEAELPAAQLDLLTPVLDSGQLVTAATSGAALRLGLTLVARTMGPKLVAMVSADLGLEEDPDKPRLEVRY
ncbi:MAG TPA: DJ-1/PfpI family protein [Polyangiaceae bacterium]|nr:DJ-1/PfpI family protein [Polyangiaceae bacterium]